MISILFISLLFQHLSAEGINCKIFGPHCMECNESSCTSCLWPSIRDKDTSSRTFGHCIICTPRCLGCLNQTHCEACLPYFGLDEKGKCVSCDDPYCDDCSTNHSECNSCIDGYSFDKNESSSSYGKCRRAIAPHCIIYNGYDKCGKCEDGYYLNHTSKECVDLVCWENCSICTGLYDCQTCNEGFGFGSGNKCQKCKDDYCGSCVIKNNNEEKCKKCKIGYYQIGDYDYRPNSKEIQCLEGIQNCKTYESMDKCKECVDEYGLDEEFKCQKCTVDKCQNCKSDYKICTSCLNGYGFDSNKQNCIKCQKENCQSCNNDYTKCSKCKKTYILDAIENSCQDKCFDPNCIACNEFDHRKCNRCKDGFMLKDSKCIKCEDENCVQCDNDASKCEECKSGYRSSDSKCVKCPENCGKCDTIDDPFYCEVCAPYYGFMLISNSEDLGKCLKCTDENCLECYIHPDYCTKCIDGYYFVNNKCSIRPSGGGGDDENNNGNGNGNGGNNEDKDNSSGGGGGGSRKLPLGAIIGIAVGGVVVVGVIIGVTVFCVKKKKRISNSSNE